MYTALLHTRCLSYYVMHAVQGDRASAACLQLHTGCSEGLRLTRGVGKTVLLVRSMRSKNLLSLAFYHFCTRQLAEGSTQGGNRCLGLPQYPGCTPHAGRREDASLKPNKLPQVPLIIITVPLIAVTMTMFIVTVIVSSVSSQNVHFNSETSSRHWKSTLRDVWGQSKGVSTLWRCLREGMYLQLRSMPRIAC